MPTILIVEDTDYCRDALEVALAGVDGTKLETVATAEAALRRIGTGGVCALVTDLHLTERPNGAASMDGFELIAAVRSHPRLAQLPILVISGDSDPGTPDRLAGLGTDAFFTKPYSPSAVRNKLEQLIHEYIREYTAFGFATDPGSGSEPGKIKSRQR